MGTADTAGIEVTSLVRPIALSIPDRVGRCPRALVEENEAAGLKFAEILPPDLAASTLASANARHVGAERLRSTITSR